jgi:AcrR family transcriptional regulator
VGRPQTIENEQILEAAREVFLRDGLAASTASIAKAAGVSEGSIFKRFPTKEALFRAAMGIPDVRIDGELAALFDGVEVEVGLERMGLRIIELFRELLPRMMMLWANCASAHLSPAESLRCLEGGQPMPLSLLRTVSHQLEQQQRKRRLRDLDPEIMARVFLGSMHNYVFFEVAGIHVRQPLAAPSFVRGVVDLLVNGAAPPRSQEIVHE